MTRLFRKKKRGNWGSFATRGNLDCSVSHYVAVCCRVLQGVAGCCRVLQGVAGCCSVVQCEKICSFPGKDIEATHWVWVILCNVKL